MKESRMVDIMENSPFTSNFLAANTQRLNRVSCFNAGHIFVDFFMIMRCTVMKFGMNIETKHTNYL